MILKNITLGIFPIADTDACAGRIVVHDNKGSAAQFPIKKGTYLQFKKVFDEFKKEKE